MKWFARLTSENDRQMVTAEASTPERQARDMLARMCVEDAHLWSNGDVVELANLIDREAELSGALVELLAATEECGRAVGFALREITMAQERIHYARLMAERALGAQKNAAPTR